MCITLGYFAICKRNPKSSRLKTIGNLLAHITGKLEGGTRFRCYWIQESGRQQEAGPVHFWASLCFTSSSFSGGSPSRGSRNVFFQFTNCHEQEELRLPDSSCWHPRPSPQRPRLGFMPGPQPVTVTESATRSCSECGSQNGAVRSPR